MILDLTPLHIVVEMTTDRLILALTSSGLENNKVMSAQKQRAIGEKLPMTLLPSDNITKKVYFGKRFKRSLYNKSDWENSTFNENLRRSTL